MRNIKRVCKEAWRQENEISDTTLTAGDKISDTTLTAGESESNSKFVDVCLMTSIENDKEIKSYFSSNHYFHYPPEKSEKMIISMRLWMVDDIYSFLISNQLIVHFFSQTMLPVINLSNHRIIQQQTPNREIW